MSFVEATAAALHLSLAGTFYEAPGLTIGQATAELCNLLNKAQVRFIEKAILPHCDQFIFLIGIRITKISSAMEEEQQHKSGRQQQKMYQTTSDQEKRNAGQDHESDCGGRKTAHRLQLVGGNRWLIQAKTIEFHLVTPGST
ncbi:hypothetical protein HN51_25450 [Ectopseudomonas mendocina]|uniref:Uncharacterized protein n=1 Tax=Ectopseudomonas mendocina S5.2 TaxID=1225174 RepID=A0ABN4J164_ECTME|nr:hypothetical protein DW68_024275 [Pseudomonas mendocina S5.2]KER98145.1 hypothetical protein HN51_25450 [Pseudomonas mendocina]